MIFRRFVSLLLSAVLILSLAAAAGAEGTSSQCVTEAICLADSIGKSEVVVELDYGQRIYPADWEALKDCGKPFALQYRHVAYTFRSKDVSRALGYESLSLSPMDVPAGLVDAICEQTGLEPNDFMLVLPETLGRMPAAATVGIALTNDFMNYNGYRNLNIYGIDIGTTTSYATVEPDEDESTSSESSEPEVVENTHFGIKALGLAASGRSAEKAYSPWIYFSTNASRLLLVTAKSLKTVGSMSWNLTSGSLTSATRVFAGAKTASTTSGTTGADTASESGGRLYGTASGAQTAAARDDDANPNTGAAEAQTLLICGIAGLAFASAVTAVRCFSRKK